MSVTLRAILIVSSIISCILCIKKIKQAKLKVENAIVWMLGSFLLIFMSVFSGVVEWCAIGLGFEAPVNFVFVIIIAFLLIEVYLNNLKITELNEKIKDIAHHIAINEHENDEEKEKNNG